MSYPTLASPSPPPLGLSLPQVPHYRFEFTPAVVGAGTQTAYIRLRNQGYLTTSYQISFPNEKQLNLEQWCEAPLPLPLPLPLPPLRNHLLPLARSLPHRPAPRCDEDDPSEERNEIISILEELRVFKVPRRAPR